MLGVCPVLLLGFSVMHGEREQILGMNGLAFGILLILAGFVAYGIKMAIQNAGWLAPPQSDSREKV
jgi:hypothetical protein